MAGGQAEGLELPRTCAKMAMELSTDTYIKSALIRYKDNMRSCLRCGSQAADPYPEFHIVNHIDVEFQVALKLLKSVVPYFK